MPAGAAVLPKSFCELEPPVWRLTAGWSALSTTLVYPSAPSSPLTQQAAMVRLSRKVGERGAMGVGAGGVFAGTLVAGPVVATMSPGATIDVLGSWVLRDGGDGGPFVTGSVALGFVRAGLGKSATYWAADVRLGVSAGYVFLERFAAYAGASVFGGPAALHAPGFDEIAGDRWHFRLSAGLMAAITYKLDAFIEAAPLGEQGLAAGLGTSF
jgi:hypothetical protein